MTKFNTREEILKNTKVITTEDYSYIIIVEGFRNGRIITGPNKAKVVDPDDSGRSNLDWAYGRIHENKIPKYQGKEDKNWELIFLIVHREIIDGEDYDNYYRYTKEEIRVANALYENFYVHQAIGYKTAENILPKEIFKDVKDLWDNI